MSEQVLSLVNVTKFYGAKLILDHVSLLINRRDHIGLVGENGTGKTTLASIILNAVEPDEGQVFLSDGVEIGYLPQEAAIEDSVTIQQFLEQALGHLDQIKRDLAALESEMSSASGKALAALLDRYGQLQDEFAQRGGYDADYRIDQVFSGLELGHLDRERLMQTLSGGEKTRVMLACLLLKSPDLLILDEPTNHLDFAAVDWIEGYLLSYQGAMLIISHDRHFLNKVVTQIAELSWRDHQLTIYHGNYDDYLAERERLLGQQIEAYEAQHEEMKTLQRLIKAKTYSAGNGRRPKDNDKMGYDFHGGRVDKTKSREIHNAKQRLEEIENNLVERPTRRWQINPYFRPESLTSQDVIRFSNVSKSYGERTLFEALSMTITSGERVVLQGPNGIGKTTLLKLIMGIEQPDTGVIKIAGGARLGYLDQEQESLNPDQTVFDAYSQGLVGTEADHRENLFKIGLFSQHEVFQQVGNLSLGQQRKLQIARVIATKANVLLLDEPTNHLDLESIEQFERALCDFQGSVIATSHDRFFIEKVATRVWVIEARQVVAL